MLLRLLVIVNANKNNISGKATQGVNILFLFDLLDSAFG